MPKDTTDRLACRREFPALNFKRCGKPAKYIVWGKLFDLECLGPRCEDCARDQLGTATMSRLNDYAVYKLPRSTDRVSLEEVREVLDGAEYIEEVLSQLERTGWELSYTDGTEGFAQDARPAFEAGWTKALAALSSNQTDHPQEPSETCECGHGVNQHEWEDGPWIYCEVDGCECGDFEAETHPQEPSSEPVCPRCGSVECERQRQARLEMYEQEAESETQQGKEECSCSPGLPHVGDVGEYTMAGCPAHGTGKNQAQPPQHPDGEERS